MHTFTTTHFETSDSANTLLTLRYLGCVWLSREVVKREISKREYEMRERDEKYDRFKILFDIRKRKERN